MPDVVPVTDVHIMAVTAVNPDGEVVFQCFGCGRVQAVVLDPNRYNKRILEPGDSSIVHVGNLDGVYFLPKARGKG